MGMELEKELTSLNGKQDFRSVNSRGVGREKKGKCVHPDRRNGGKENKCGGLPEREMTSLEMKDLENAVNQGSNVQGKKQVSKRSL